LNEIIPIIFKILGLFFKQIKLEPQHQILLSFNKADKSSLQSAN